MSFGSYLAIAIYFGFLLFIGRYFYDKNASMNEYLLDNRQMGPVVTALSAGASDMSGWMLLGVPGALYATGVANVWMIAGLIVGAYCNYLFLAKRLRVYTEVASDSITIPDFLELYVSSGIIAGGKTFESFFGLKFAYGAVFTLIIVVFYTFFGGFKAVSITDAFQGLLMFCVLVSIPVVAYLNLDLPSDTNLIKEISRLDANHLNPFRDQTFWGILGLLAWGFGYFGQPHIIVRFMAIRDSKELAKARRIGIGWMTIGLLGAIMSGLIGFVYFSQRGGLSDPETVFLKLGELLFPPFFIGIIISAVLSAIMSTISSQLLVTSSSVTKDFIFAFYKKEVSQSTQTAISRYAVVVVAIIATVLAFISTDNVLNVVGNAWAGFGASFGPVLLFSLYWKRMSALGALAGMIAGGVTVIFWITSGLNAYVYEILPGILTSSLAIIMVSIWGDAINKMTSEPHEQVIKDEFEKMKTRL